ncbi:MAG: M1 family metallopeptidase [Bacteroidales bacterium]|nr:M1 family metallopeptidase [Bacteroidales bacterium]
MKAIFTIFAIVLIYNTIAQDIPLYEIPEFQKAIINEARTRKGEPGIKYWQNSSDYTLEVSLDTSKNILKGRGSIVYHNNSPKTLKNIHVRLYQDVYKTGSARNFPVLAEDIHSGIYIDSLSINSKHYIHFNESINQSITNRINTDLYIQLFDSIVSGTSCVIEIAWSFTVPSSPWPRRMGRYTNDYFIAQWYPQVAVYDDILGWDIMPHYGLQEFYNDFNNFDVTIKVPEGYMVWATGECNNLRDVLDQSVINKLNTAKKSDSYVAIINSDSYRNDFFRGNTWHFLAENVPDFAFAAATNYIWYGTSVIVDQLTGRRALIDIVYPEESSFPANSLQVARDAILWTSRSFPGIPYPFSHATSFFNDLGNGVCMEFPMIANDMIDHDVGPHNAALVHELLHNYFPFYVGLNETIFGWMDEGWVNFLENKYTGDDFSLLEQKGLIVYPSIAGSIYDRPLFSSTMDESTFNRGILSYTKPAVNLMLLEELMGEEAFLNATKDFINKWNGKHPTPYDFFNIFKNHAEDDISWFLKVCYFDYGYADLGIESVNGNIITISKKGNIPVSIKLEITFDDNTTEKIYKNPGIWKTGAIEFIVNLDTNRIIKKIILGDSLTPDIDMSNNFYQR